METQSPRAVIYCRISSDPEGKAAGVERQEADCRDLAGKLGYSVARVFVENDVGASTRSRKARPLYREMIQGAQAGLYSAILAYSNSRLTRRPSEWEELIRLYEDTRTVIHTVASGKYDLSTADGRATARTVAAWDAAEAERTAERVQRAKDDSVVKGEWRGGPRPFGYEADGLTVRPQEAAALERAADGIIAGQSLSAVTREINAAGLTTTSAKARPMTSIALRNILLRPRNAGLMEVKGEIIGHAQWPAVIPEDKWFALRGVLTDPARRTQKSSENRWLGSHLFRCGEKGCTDTVRGAATTGRDRLRRLVYRCRSGRHVNRDLLQTDDYVKAVIVAYLRRPDNLAKFPVHHPNRAEVEAKKADIRALRTRRGQLADDYALGLLDGPQVHAATMRLDRLIEDAERALEAAGRGNALAEVLAAEDPGQEFLDAPLDRQRAIIDAVAVVTIEPAPRGRPKGHVPGTPYFDPKYIRIDPKGVG